FPAAVIATERDALAFGLSSGSDGRHVVIACAAPELAAASREPGYEPVPVAISAVLEAARRAECRTRAGTARAGRAAAAGGAAGGGPRCRTLGVRPRRG